MDTELLFRLLTFIFFVATFGVSIYFRHRADRQGGQLDKSEGQPLIAILRLLGLLLLLPLFGYWINPDWVTWARLPLPDWLRWFAVGIAALMLPMIYWLFSTIGNNISPSHTTRSDHKLVTSGPYRWIRHPLYTFGVLFFFAVSIATALWWFAIGMIIAFLLIALRTPREEAHLIAKFGDEYRAYMQRTGRYLPRFF